MSKISYKISYTIQFSKIKMAFYTINEDSKNKVNGGIARWSINPAYYFILLIIFSN